MKHYHWLVLRGLPGPFFGWLGLLLFLLLMQFLMKYLPDLAGRDLPLPLVIELIAYNLAYMVVLAVPMSALLAVLMAYGSLSESRAYVAIKASGVSAMAIVWPALIAGGVLSIGMTYVNNVTLPEANFRARNLWQDIHTKRPGFELQPGVFYDGLSDYAILVKHRTGNSLQDILVYDHTDGKTGATIKAQSGELVSKGSDVALDLRDGEVHRILRDAGVGYKERYERLHFDRMLLTLDLSEFQFERTSPTDGHRSDRSTRTSVMIRVVDSLATLIDSSRAQIRASAPLASSIADETSAEIASFMDIGAFAAETARMRADEADRVMRTVDRLSRWKNRYSVEVHKKYSIATACIIFVLLGAPLGLSIRRGGLGVSAGVALGVFLLYWTTLVQGEKLADRGLLSPWISMWSANIIIGLLAVATFVYVALDLRATPRLSARLRQRRK